MRKLTVRVPDEVGAAFAEFCAIAGISQQGAIEAAIRQTVERYEANARRPPEQWEPMELDSTARWLAGVDLARRLDAERRGRKSQ